jgi:hypothetical protein
LCAQWFKFINRSEASVFSNADGYIDLSVHLRQEYYCVVLMAACSLLLMLVLGNLFIEIPGLDVIAMTMRLAGAPLSAFVAALGFLLFVLAFAFHLTFGGEVQGYATMTEAMMTLYLALVGGDIQYAALVEKSWLVAPVLAVLFTAFGTFVILTVAVAIFTDAYTAAVKLQRGKPSNLRAYFAALSLVRHHAGPAEAERCCRFFDAEAAVGEEEGEAGGGKAALAAVAAMREETNAKLEKADAKLEDMRRDAAEARSATDAKLEALGHTLESILAAVAVGGAQQTERQ